MPIQNYDNHRKFKPETRSHNLYYLCFIFLFSLSVYNMCNALGNHSGRLIAGILILMSITFMVAYFVFRSFSLKAQDRAIMAEENLRHFALTGKLLDKTLTISQIIALRFAPDDEFVALAERAVKERLSNNDIKRAVKNWREDNYRV